TPEAAAADTTVRVVKPQNKNLPWVVRRDPSAEDLTIDVAVRTEFAPGVPMAVPVFAVTEVVQQRGTITVGGPAHVRLGFKPAADLTRREAADDTGHDAVFSYY